MYRPPFAIADLPCNVSRAAGSPTREAAGPSTSAWLFLFSGMVSTLLAAALLLGVASPKPTPAETLDGRPVESVRTSNTPPQVAGLSR